jgi:hypothetical protein
MLTKRNLMRSAALAAITTTISKSGLLLAQTSTERPGFFKAKDIAEAAFIYGLPIVMNYGVMYQFAIDRSSGQFKAPFNQIHNEANVFTYKDTAVVTPNSDTPYSTLFMDLRAEPLILSFPKVDPKRYYSVQLCDGNTYNYGYIGSRTTGNEPGDYMVVGPDWKGPVPPPVKKVFRSSTQLSAAAYRTQLFNPGDIENIRKIQAGYKVQTLSQFLKQPPPPAAPAIDNPKFDKKLVNTNFFEYLDFALQFAPSQANEVEIRAQLARIGVGPGKTFNFITLSPEDKAEIASGMKEGDRKVEEAVASAGKAINGWRVGGLSGGDSAFYRGDWLKRAVVAKAGIYASDPEEVTYPFTRVDSDGELLDGSKYNYVLTFQRDRLPPVNAFWSVTMYDAKTQLLIKNAINRYLINSPMLPELKKNEDGSLTIYIQNKAPGGDKETNWLPAPNGPIYLVMRLYWPSNGPPSILPLGKGLWKPPGVQRIS